MKLTFTKNALKSGIKLIVCAVLFPAFAYAQVSGDYRSIATGTWNSAATWQKYGSSGWGAATGAPSSTSTVTIQSTNTVTLTGSGNCTNLVIQAGGALISDGTTQQSLSIKGDTVENDGLLGGFANAATGYYPDSINLEIKGSGADFILFGAGITRINRLEGYTPNVGTIINIAQNATFTHMSTTLGSQVGLSAYYPSTTGTADVVTLNLPAGDTATFINGAVLHFATAYTNDGGGSYTYNLNGVVDESHSVGHTCFIPNSVDATSTLTVNINNLFILGGGLNLVNTNPAVGNAIITIAPGATVDASAVVYMYAGTASMIMADGTSKMKRVIAAADSLYPISIGVNDYNGVTLNNSGTPDTFTVKLKNTFDIAPADLTKVVQRQWTITEAVAGGSNDSMKLAWLTGAQNPAFTPTHASIYYVSSGGVVTEYPATVTGSGTLADPYIASAGGITNFGEFYVGNASPTGVNSVNAAVTTVKVFPNPVSNKQVHLEMDGQAEGTYQVSVMNATGQVVYKGEVLHSGSVTNHTINLSNEITAGYYELHLTGEKEHASVSMIVR